MGTWNVKKLLDWGIDYFKKKDIPESRLSAELLLSSVLGFSRVKLYLNYNYEPTRAELEKFKMLIQKRLEHIPIQYILKEAFFRRIKLHVTQDVLIPRPETELLVEEALSAVRSFAGDKMINIMEIGTGSGAIAISLADELEIEDFHIIATDDSKKALEIAKKNAQEILEKDKSDRIDFLCADIIPKDIEFREKYGSMIDILVSNPPYISNKGFDCLPRQVREYEPKRALVAGKTGSETYSRIFEQVKPFLSQSSFMAVEIDDLVSGTVLEQFREVYGSQPIIKKDYNSKDRILVAWIRKDAPLRSSGK